MSTMLRFICLKNVFGLLIFVADKLKLVSFGGMGKSWGRGVTLLKPEHGYFVTLCSACHQWNI